jgi:hypothetical protein
MLQVFWQQGTDRASGVAILPIQSPLSLLASLVFDDLLPESAERALRV